MTGNDVPTPPEFPAMPKPVVPASIPGIGMLSSLISPDLVTFVQETTSRVVETVLSSLKGQTRAQESMVCELSGIKMELRQLRELLVHQGEQPPKKKRTKR